MVKVSWLTEDDCVSCGHSGMRFDLTEIVPAPDIFGDPSIEAVGFLTCPMCGDSSLSYADASMIPDEITGLSPHDVRMGLSETDRKVLRLVISEQTKRSARKTDFRRESDQKHQSPRIKLGEGMVDFEFDSEN